MVKDITSFERFIDNVGFPLLYKLYFLLNMKVKCSDNLFTSMKIVFIFLLLTC